MEKQCTYFKYYFEPYNGKRKHTYRGKEVRAFAEKHVNDILRPVFNWSANEVIEYIKKHGLEVNPLYKKGFKRVGCFPCVMSNQTDIKNLNRFYPERVQELAEHEKKIGSSLFPPDKIPKRFCSNGSHPTILEVAEYVAEPTIFTEIEEQENACFSFYNICE